MKYLVLAFVGCFVSFCAVAQDRSIGVSIQGGSTLFMSFDIGESLRIEPSIFYSNSKSTGEVASENESVELLLGVFERVSYSAKVTSFYGARLGYAANKVIYKTNSYLYGRTGAYGIGDVSDRQHLIRDEHRYEGYKIAPTLGVEYHFIENLSLVGEVSINYKNVNGNAKTDTNTYTDTGLSVHFYF
jgi:hypothetical protein